LSAQYRTEETKKILYDRFVVMLVSLWSKRYYVWPLFVSLYGIRLHRCISGLG